MSKLEPQLLNIAQRAEGQRDLLAAGRAEGSRVSIAVKFTGDVADLAAAGFDALTVKTHPTDGFAIAVGLMPVERLTELDGIAHIVKVEGSRPMRPELNRSVAEIRAKALHSGTPPSRGAGVVVGIIDSGVDFTHHSFRKSDGTTRILGLWDQTLKAGAGEHAPAGFGGLGVEYSEDDINATLAGGLDVRSRDVLAHGTEVAGIAAGDGSQADGCHGPFTYVGVAPDADLIVVKYESSFPMAESWNLIHALDFIWDHAAAAGKAIVINISLGSSMGSHDGTALLEQMIDIDLLHAGGGRVVVKSAGNEGDKKRHAEGTVQPGSMLPVTFAIAPNTGGVQHMELWYPGAGRLSVAVAAPEPGQLSPTVSPLPAPAARVDWIVDPSKPAPQRTTVHIDSRLNDPDNHDNFVHIEIEPAGRRSLPAGKWELRLGNLGPTPVPFDCWIERDDVTPEFTSHATRSKTLTIPGTATRAITVGAYAQESALFFNGTGDLGPFSSFGPTRKAPPNTADKPDIAAPGVGITSALAGAPPAPCCACCVDYYTTSEGTSFSAPHVTGAVALLFERNPTMDADEVKQHLRAAARRPSIVSGTLPDAGWGAGKLDVSAALGRVQAPPSPPPEPDDRAGGDTAPAAFSSSPATSAWPSASQPPPMLVALHRRALATSDGEVYAALASRHFSEIRALITHNPRVGVKWQRLDGPRLLSMALRHVLHGEPIAPIDRAALRPRAEAFLTGLTRYGSPQLRDDVAALRELLLALCAPDSERTPSADQWHRAV